MVKQKKISSRKITNVVRSGKKIQTKNDVRQDISQKKYFLGRRTIKLIIVILILILIGLIVFFLIEQDYLSNPFTNYGKIEQKFSVVDECSLIVGNLIHQIDDEGICESRCKQQCQVRAMDYVRFEYSEIEQDCNICDCYCK